VDTSPRNRKRDALVGVGIALVLAVVVVVSGHEQNRGIRVPDLTGIAVRQSSTMLEVRGLKLGTLRVRECRRLELPATVLDQQPDPRAFVVQRSLVNVTTCAPVNG